MSPVRWVMKLRRLLCNALSFVRMHRPDCEHCNSVEECWGIDMRKRLQELGESQQEPTLQQLLRVGDGVTIPLNRTHQGEHSRQHSSDDDKSSRTKAS